MVLKKAVKYKVFLQSLLSDAHVKLKSKDFTMSRWDSKNDKNEKASKNLIEIGRGFSLEQVIDLIKKISDEIDGLTYEIQFVKCSSDYYEIEQIMNNKMRVYEIYRELLDNCKPDYKWKDINAVEDGDVVNQYCEPNFDRKKLRSIVCDLNDEIQKDADKLDELNSSLEVCFTPSYSIGRTLEDILEDTYNL